MYKKILLILTVALFAKNLFHKETTYIYSKAIVKKQSKVINTKRSFDLYVNHLPHIIDLTYLSDIEIHGTPDFVLSGAEYIAKIQIDAQKNKELRMDALSFFKKCVENQEVLSSIRAICLNKLYILIPKWKLAMPLDPDFISQEVEELALQVR